MKRKHVLLGIVALLGVGGLWLGRETFHSGNESSGESTAANFQIQEGQKEPGQTNGSQPHLAPPDQTRRFRDSTPEQRVEQARKGHGPGG